MCAYGWNNRTSKHPTPHGHTTFTSSIQHPGEGQNEQNSSAFSMRAMGETRPQELQSRISFMGSAYMCILHPEQYCLPIGTSPTADRWSFISLYRYGDVSWSSLLQDNLWAGIHISLEIKSKVSNLRTCCKGCLYLLLAWGENLLALEYWFPWDRIKCQAQNSLS